MLFVHFVLRASLVCGCCFVFLQPLSRPDHEAEENEARNEKDPHGRREREGDPEDQDEDKDDAAGKEPENVKDLTKSKEQSVDSSLKSSHFAKEIAVTVPLSAKRPISPALSASSESLGASVAPVPASSAVSSGSRIRATSPAPPAIAATKDW